MRQRGGRREPASAESRYFASRPPPQAPVLPSVDQKIKPTQRFFFVEDTNGKRKANQGRDVFGGVEHARDVRVALGRGRLEVFDELGFFLFDFLQLLAQFLEMKTFRNGKKGKEEGVTLRLSCCFLPMTASCSLWRWALQNYNYKQRINIELKMNTRKLKRRRKTSNILFEVVECFSALGFELGNALPERLEQLPLRIKAVIVRQGRIVL